MNHYRIRTTGEVVTLAGLRDAIPSTFIPDGPSQEYLNDLGVDIVRDAPAPQLAPGQILDRDTVVQDSSMQWIYLWKVTAMPADAVAADLQAEIAMVLRRIDESNDGIYGRVVGNRLEEYRTAEEQAQAFKDAGYVGTVPPYVDSYAVAANQTPTWAADDILATAAKWRDQQQTIRANRLTIKRQAQVAPDISSLQAIEATWNKFVSDTYTALGITQ